MVDVNLVVQFVQGVDFSHRNMYIDCKIESCHHEVQNLIAINWLNLNNSKAESIIFGTKEYL